MRKQKEKLRKQFHSPFPTKRIKYLGIYLPKETEDLYTDYKINSKWIKDLNVRPETIKPW